MRSIIKPGQIYKTKNVGDFHGKATLLVKKVSGQGPDDWTTFEATPKIPYKRHYNKFAARNWWVREWCRKG